MRTNNFPHKRVGAVLVFQDGVTKTQAEEVLRDLEKRGLVDGSEWVENKTPVHEYVAAHGGPVWYIP